MHARPATAFARLFALGLVTVLALAACSGGGRTQSGLIKRVNPPSASLERLVVDDDRAVRVAVRLQNFSTVPTRFGRLDATVSIDGRAAGRLAFDAGIEIPGLSSDVVEASLALDAAALARLAGAGDAVAYRLQGAIATTEPEDEYEFTFESRLNPVPGRPGEFR